MTRRARGALEGQVLRILWEADEPVTSGQVRDGFPEAGRPALTTVLTVLDRLEDKGVVQREPRTGGALFSATHTEPEQTAASMTRVLDQSGDRAAALLRFTGQLSADDHAALRRALGGERG